MQILVHNFPSINNIEDRSEILKDKKLFQLKSLRLLRAAACKESGEDFNERKATAQLL